VVSIWQEASQCAKYSNPCGPVCLSVCRQGSNSHV
jgi:hypothetical protein